MGTLIVVLGSALVLVAAAVPAAAVARGRVAQFVVAVWVISFAEVVAVSIALSVVSALTRTWLLVALTTLALISVAAGRRWGFGPPSARHAAAAAREVLGDRVLLVLAVGAVVALGYSAALALFTPPTEHDALTYHLLRAATWKQEHGIAWIHAPVDLRANANPIVAEVGVAWTMILDGGERFVALPQLTALVACMFGVFALSRRVGLDRRASAFGGLCVAFLPVALVQSSTAMNDVVPAGFAVAVAVFAVGQGRADLLLGGLALALMIGTKGSTFVALPALAAIAAVAQPTRRWPAYAAVGAAAAAVGATWFLVTRRNEGDATGGLASSLGSNDPTDPVVGVARFTRYFASALEVPGVGRDQWLYVLVGIGLLAVAIATRRRAVALAGIAVAALPLLVLARGGADEVYKRAWWRLGRPDVVRFDDGDRNGTLVTAGHSWYGPVAVLLTLGALVLVVREARARRIDGVALVLALAPAITIATLAFALVWSPVFGRLVMPGVMLGAAVWGVVYPIRWAAIAAVAASILVGLMSFWWFDVKQAGLRLLEPPHDVSGWSKSRSQLQDYENGIAPFLEATDRLIPRDAVVAVNRPGPAPYTVFGSDLRRTVRMVDATSKPAAADWYLGPTGTLPPCAGSWRRVTTPASPYWLLRRIRGGCAR